MATYAAYRHIELDNIGYGKKRVLKPPGGGSSDIFGGSESASEVRRVARAKQQTSQLFLGSSTSSSITSSSSSSSASSTASDHADAPSNGVASAKKTNGTSSYQRLFGEYQIPSTPSKNYMKSNIVLDCVETDSGCGSKTGSSGSGSQASTPERGNSPRESSKSSLRGSPPRNPVTGDGCDVTRRHNGQSLSARRRDGNPVTGEGYDASSKPSTPLTNGNLSPPSTAQARQRVPPGGFSSGLW
ncbi:microtubule-associated protein Jupiter isoform X2 [Nilaparvata lugens]|uniref:microtubule-associated protein Jupiter isoform X2 n=1 Tax=Nilaparvata lugens TaxID=108931 RepID=UPI00193E6994|nr:microtubule-associated protein Jupiter isoform X2 [Nilaparvata lugens]